MGCQLGLYKKVYRSDQTRRSERILIRRPIGSYYTTTPEYIHKAQRVYCHYDNHVQHRDKAASYPVAPFKIIRETLPYRIRASAAAPVVPAPADVEAEA